MASLCKNLRLARHGANCINHGLSPRRSFSTSANSSVTPPLTHLKHNREVHPQNTGRVTANPHKTITLTTPAATDEAIVEMREASPAHMLIKIDSFSLLGKHGIDKYETGDFKAGGYKWKLIIQPNGRGKDDHYVSVKLAVSDTSTLPENWEVNAFFSICLFNHISGNYRYALGRTRRFHAMKSEWGVSKFISKKDLKDPSNGYLINDNCVFGVDVFVNENKAVTEYLSLKNDNDPYKQDIKIPNFSECDDIWCSNEFEAGGHKWKICLYPYGSGEESGRSLGAYVIRVPSNNSCQRVKASYTLRIKNQIPNHKHIQKNDSRWFVASTSDDYCGWDSFVELATLNDPTKGLIVNDCIRLQIELSVQAIADKI